MANFRATMLRPGFLVSLKTQLTGNATYARRDIEPEHNTATGEQIAKWETERTIADPVEHKAGGTARASARSAIVRICTQSTFGLLCPEDRSTELSAAIGEARRIADEFNGTANVSKLFVAVIVGRVAQDDVEAARAINSEVRSLLDEMEQGIKRLDVDAVRDAANRARSLGQMLQPAAAERVQLAISAARDVARRMVKAGDQAAETIDQATLNAIATARTAFLDLDQQAAIGDVDATESRAIDLAPGASFDYDEAIGNIKAALDVE